MTNLLDHFREGTTRKGLFHPCVVCGTLTDNLVVSYLQIRTGLRNSGVREYMPNGIHPLCEEHTPTLDASPRQASL